MDAQALGARLDAIATKTTKGIVNRKTGRRIAAIVSGCLVPWWINAVPTRNSDVAPTTAPQTAAAAAVPGCGPPLSPPA